MYRRAVRFGNERSRVTRAQRLSSAVTVRNAMQNRSLRSLPSS